MDFEIQLFFLYLWAMWPSGVYFFLCASVSSFWNRDVVSSILGSFSKNYTNYYVKFWPIPSLQHISNTWSSCFHDTRRDIWRIQNLGGASFLAGCLETRVFWLTLPEGDCVLAPDPIPVLTPFSESDHSEFASPDLDLIWGPEANSAHPVNVLALEWWPVPGIASLNYVNVPTSGRTECEERASVWAPGLCISTLGRWVLGEGCRAMLGKERLLLERA